ncbi:anthranilate synthase component I family protein [Corynebacterium evansiae]|uniref:Anthranilate synthase component I family protein n=1 Tax=Corynebacterium evansiae TaxID=2913499 RepID=A0A9X3LN72_9CORY|nr:anthranilate synthase component I family protein [Corynebacterium evansiae]MCZ9290230.1 anthranilate synthase component I family protein [Corynebacterium evansiae]
MAYMTPRRLTFRTIPLPQADARDITGSVAPRVFLSLFNDAPTAAWLDSSGNGGALSVLANSAGPLARTWMPQVESSNTFFAQLRSTFDESVEIPRDWPCDFTLGWVGALGYGVEDIARSREDHPDAALLFADRAVVIDHAHAVAYAMAMLPSAKDAGDAGSTHDEQLEWLDTTVAEVRRIAGEVSETSGAGLEAIPETFPSSIPGGAPPRDTVPAERAATFHFDQPKQQYLASIQRCLDYIAAGDSYEVCLTNTARGPALRELVGLRPTQQPGEHPALQSSEQPGANSPQEQSPELLAYLRLREVSPVPYGAFLRFDRPGQAPLHILSASPERFLKVSPEGEVSAKPIKGTRPRGEDEAADARGRQELMSNPKDRAENLMIVDLLRNDLGRVCVPGSVEVPKIFSVESFSHVHQLVSTITGQLRPGLGAVDAIAASYPGGSMTGAPKIRTMEIIEELEPHPRGFYSGAIGWISPNSATELNITIRTLVDDGAECSFGVGGAIVADSDPLAEYQETLVKAAALLDTLGGQIA